MTMDLADCTRGNSDNAEDGKVKEPLSQIRLDEIRRDVTASASTWAALRQQYPPGESCFERLNFTVSSWSATVNDVTGLGDDLDADEAYSQAAAMAAYGVDILSTALSGQTVDRKLAEQARKLFATLCATLMDTRDRHRCSINRAVVEKVGAFRRILGELDSPPQQTEDISSCSERTERDEQTEDTREAPLHDKVERQYSPMAHGNELQITGSSKNDRRHPYYQGRSQSPDLQQYQQSHDQRTIRRTSATSLLGRSLQDIRLSAQYSVPLPATPKATHQAWASDEVINSSRQRVIRTALLRHGMSESSIVEYIDRHSRKTNYIFDKRWNGWVKWCDRLGIDPIKRSVDNLSQSITDARKHGFSTFMLKPALYSVWWAVEGDIYRKEPWPLVSRQLQGDYGDFVVEPTFAYYTLRLVCFPSDMPIQLYAICDTTL